MLAKAGQTKAGIGSALIRASALWCLAVTGSLAQTAPAKQAPQVLVPPVPVPARPATQAQPPATQAPAAQAPQPSAQTSGAGNVGASAWTQSVTRDGAVVGVQLDEKQMVAIGRVSAYFNSLKNLKGSFVQTTADNKRMRGIFYVKQPGRFRFDYSRPSLQVIVSNGQEVAIQDNDLNTDDRLALDQTPMRVLLRKDVDLLRDARIFDVQESADLVMVIIQDKAPDTGGRIKLLLVKAGADLELKEWVTTDAQGLDTKLEVSNLVKTEEIDARLFEIKAISLRRLQ